MGRAERKRDGKEERGRRGEGREESEEALMADSSPQGS